MTATLRFETGELHVGDCLDVMRGMPPASVRLIVTSPPYNIGASSGGASRIGNARRPPPQPIFGGTNGRPPAAGRDARRSRGAERRARRAVPEYDEHCDDMPHEEYVRWQRDCLAEMWRLLSDDGAIYYNHRWRVRDGRLLDSAPLVEGLPLRQTIVWQRSGGYNFNSGYYLPTFEVIHLIAKPAFRLARGGNAATDVWTIREERAVDHPAPFPVALPETAIRTAGGGSVLDPFMGSGSTAVAAVRCGVRWIGIEISPRYADLAGERVRAAERQLPLPIAAAGRDAPGDRGADIAALAA